MGPSAPTTSPFTGAPCPGTETSVQPWCILKNPPSLLPQLTRTFSSPGSRSPLCNRPSFGIICPLFHEGPLSGRGVPRCLSTPLLPKAAAAPFYFNNHNFHPPFPTLPWGMDQPVHR